MSPSPQKEAEDYSDNDGTEVEILRHDSCGQDDRDSDENFEEDNCVSDEDFKVTDDNDDVDSGNDGDQLTTEVDKILQGGGSLEALRLKECKDYLRKNGLRIGGTKAVCIERITEHWRIRSGNSEDHYPVSSFVIDCTGDVCKGDVVLFRQKVHERSSRTVTGRIVKESYGVAKQQHTFTIEIFWSKGAQKLPALYPLLVKGRNLYKLKTFRQPWENEAERIKALEEKHRRGTAARKAREARKAKRLQLGCVETRKPNEALKDHNGNGDTRCDAGTKKTRETGKKKLDMSYSGFGAGPRKTRAAGKENNVTKAGGGETWNRRYACNTLRVQKTKHQFPVAAPTVKFKASSGWHQDRYRHQKKMFVPLPENSYKHRERLNSMALPGSRFTPIGFSNEEERYVSDMACVSYYGGFDRDAGPNVSNSNGARDFRIGQEMGYHQRKELYSRYGSSHHDNHFQLAAPANNFHGSRDMKSFPKWTMFERHNIHRNHLSKSPWDSSNPLRKQLLP